VAGSFFYRNRTYLDAIERLRAEGG